MTGKALPLGKGPMQLVILGLKEGLDGREKEAIRGLLSSVMTTETELGYLLLGLGEVVGAVGVVALEALPLGHRAVQATPSGELLFIMALEAELRGRGVIELKGIRRLVGIMAFGTLSRLYGCMYILGLCLALVALVAELLPLGLELMGMIGAVGVMAFGTLSRLYGCMYILGLCLALVTLVAELLPLGHQPKYMFPLLWHLMALGAHILRRCRLMDILLFAQRKVTGRGTETAFLSRQVNDRPGRSNPCQQRDH